NSGATDATHNYWGPYSDDEIDASISGSGVDSSDRLATLACRDGFMVDGFGGTFGIGLAPSPVDGPYWPGWDIARAVATRADGVAGYVLDGWGGLHRFGGAPAPTRGPYWPGSA